MKVLIIITITFISFFGFSQDYEFESYELLTNVKITKCRVIANFEGKKSEFGSVESIDDSTVMLRIAKGKRYTVIINDYLFFEINKNKSINTSFSDSILASSSSSKGLVYRIQVGAYAKKIESELFSEFQELYQEKIIGTEIIRYMVGTYLSKSEVKKALIKIKQAGYLDAFVVAYYDGKRKY